MACRLLALLTPSLQLLTGALISCFDREWKSMTVRGRDMAFRWVLAVIVCICAAARAGAQDVTALLPSRVLQLPPLVVADDGVSPAERVLAVEEWTREYQDWKSWHQRWRNKLEPGWFSARARRQPPTPP